MALERGASWGRPGALPAGAPVVRTDAALRAIVEAARRDGAALPVVGLLGGDLCRTVGGRGDERRLRSDDAVQLPVDVVRVTLDGRDHWFVAHLVAATPLWARCTLAMNAQWRGRWDVAPSGHPGDGAVDVLEASLPLGQRIEAWRRVRTGTHVPHPQIRSRRTPSVELRWDAPRHVLLDGDRVAHTDAVALVVEPAALTVVV